MAKPKTKPKKRAPRPSKLARTVRDLGAQAIAEGLGVHPQTVRRWARDGTTPANRKRVNAVVLSPEVVLAAKVQKFHRQAEKHHRIKPPDEGWNKTATVDLTRYEGTTSNKRVKKLLTPRSEEEVILQVEKLATKIAKKQRSGHYYMTFSMYEYGRQIAGSPGAKMYKDGAGYFYQSFDSTLGAASVVGLTEQARNVMGKLMGTPQSAVLIDSITVKRYRDKSLTEQMDFRDDRKKRNRKKRKKR